jgi:hypothetical protein
MKKLALSIPICLIYLSVFSQYYSDRPLEMTFEQSDFFFNPSFLNPLGTNNFKDASVLTSDQPLIGLQRNPSNLSNFDSDTLSSNYIYLDFRNIRKISSNRYGGIWPMMSRYAYDYVGPGWSYYQTSQRSELTPLISAAYLSRIPVLNRSVTAGITYQLINQAEGYYAIPNDIYRNLAGRTTDGMYYAGMESYTITDRFSGSDEMYNEGHAVNAYLSWEISEEFKMGFKTGRFLFQREGSLGSNNLWNQQIDYVSHWKSKEARTQDYNHWDYSIGMEYLPGKDYKFGVYGGIVTGQVNQNMVRDDNSMSKSGQAGTNQWSDYESWYISDQNWNHKGNNLYTGIIIDKQVRDDLSLRFMYNLSYLKQDILLNSSIESESENSYYYSGSNYVSESEGNSEMHDFRIGGGEREIKKNLFNFAMLWNLNEKRRLSVGTIIGFRDQSTKTSERVDAFSESYNSYEYMNSGTLYSNEYYNKTVEDKLIQWTYTSNLRSIQFPVIYESIINERFSFLLGFNRIMNFWKIENSSLILYDYRERVNNQQSLIEQMTGERITEPRERMSISTTSLIGGLIFSPAKLFTIELIASPGFEKNSLLEETTAGMQFWISMKFRP